MSTRQRMRSLLPRPHLTHRKAHSPAFTNSRRAFHSVAPCWEICEALVNCRPGECETAVSRPGINESRIVQRHNVAWRPVEFWL